MLRLPWSRRPRRLAARLGAGAPPLSAAEALALLARPDLGAALDPAREADRGALIAWCRLHGRNELPALAAAPDPAVLAGQRAWAAAPLDPAADGGPAPAGGLPLPRIFAAALRWRPDAAAAHDLADPAGRARAALWFWLDAWPELGLEPLLPGRRRVLSAPWRCPAAPRRTLPAAARAVRLARPDLGHDLADPEGVADFALWFALHGAAEHGLDGLLDPGALAWLGRAPRRRPPPAALALRRLRPDLQAAFDPADPAGAAALAAWFRLGGAAETGLLRPPAAPEAPAPAATPAAARPPLSTAGVNLAGYPRGRFGIAEDVRMAAAALAAAGVPVSVFDLDEGRSAGAAGDPALDPLIARGLPHRATLLCVAPLDMARAALRHPGLADTRHARVGCWPWELPDWPDSAGAVYAAVDEIWASSDYTRRAFRAAPVPVLRMPMAVALPPPAPLGRRDFGLPEGDRLFLFMFDGLSGLARKNPLACVEAFRRAFPGRAGVGLVVKAMNPDPAQPAWRALEAAAAADPRIRLVAETLPRAEALALAAACDAFVSLHRAEGFGRGLAEAMLLGRPVVATAFSGSDELVRPGCALPVPWRPVRLAPGDYPLGEGQWWAEPDVDAAAAALRRLADEPGLAERLGGAGRRLVESAHAPAAIGRAYAARLRRAGWLA